jgi:hypothetical protein
MSTIIFADEEDNEQEALLDNDSRFIEDTGTQGFSNAAAIYSHPSQVSEP